MRRLLFVELATIAALAAIGALGFHRVFVGRSFIGPVVGAALLASSLATIAAVRRSSISASLLLSTSGFVVYTIYAVLGDTAPNVVPTLRTFRELLGGLTGGWADLLTISLPARDEPRLLVVAVALAWLGSGLGCELAARSRGAVAPVVPPLVTYAATLAFAASEPRSTLALPLGAAALALLAVLLHTNRWAVLEPAGRRAARGGGDADGGRGAHPAEVEPSVDVSADRWVLIGLPVIAVAVAAAGLIAPSLPVRKGAFDPRSLRSQDVSERFVINPLAGLKAELKRDPADPPVVFTFETPTFRDASAIPRVRLAILDHFDGASWSSTARYSKVGTVLPQGPALEVPTRPIRQRFTIGDLDMGPWLPEADRPVSIDAGAADSEVSFDSENGTLVTSRPDRTGLTYEIVSEVPLLNEADLAALSPPSGGELREQTVLPPDLPPELSEGARTFTSSASTAYAKLQALQSALSTGYGYSEDVEPGHSYGRLVQFLTEDRRGYAEQFAASFAVMARVLGFPARLAVGYLTTEPGQNSGEVNVLTNITSRQAHTWPEVYLEGAGWVPFEPTPPRVPTDPPPQEAQPQPAPGSGFTEAQAEPQVTGGEQGVTEPPADPALSSGWLAVLTLLAAIVLLLAVLVLAKALLRRSRRRGADPAEQVLGAWAAVTDRLLEVGVPVERSMTAKEVVVASSARVAPVATERLTAMVPLVTMALYAPTPPGDERAEEMWAHADAFHREVLHGQRWWSGIAAWLNPRPLLNTLGRH